MKINRNREQNKDHEGIDRLETVTGRPLARRISKRLGLTVAKLTPSSFAERVERQVDAKRDHLIERYLQRHSGEPVPGLGHRALRAVAGIAPLKLVHTLDAVSSERASNKSKPRR